MNSRRSFIKWTVGMAAGSLMGLSPLASWMRTAFASGKKLLLPPDTKRESLVRKNPAELDTRNLPVTPLEDFGTMGLSDHRVDPAEYRLEVKGLVTHTLSLELDRVLDLPPVERNVLLICPGFFANHGQWKGVAVPDILKLAGIDDRATHVTIQGPRGAYTSKQRFPLAELRSRQVFLAYAVNGKTLPMENGFPLRVVAEGYYGYDWIKYVDTLVVESPESGAT